MEHTGAYITFGRNLILIISSKISINPSRSFSLNRHYQTIAKEECAQFGLTWQFSDYYYKVLSDYEGKFLCLDTIKAISLDITALENIIDLTCNIGSQEESCNKLKGELRDLRFQLAEAQANYKHELQQKKS